MFQSRALAHMLHLVDVSSLSERNPIEDYEIINRELANYNQNLAYTKAQATLLGYGCLQLLLGLVVYATNRYSVQDVVLDCLLGGVPFLLLYLWLRQFL